MTETLRKNLISNIIDKQCWNNVFISFAIFEQHKSTRRHFKNFSSRRRFFTQFALLGIASVAFLQPFSDLFSSYSSAPAVRDNEADSVGKSQLRLRFCCSETCFGSQFLVSCVISLFYWNIYSGFLFFLNRVSPRLFKCCAIKINRSLRLIGVINEDIRLERFAHRSRKTNKRVSVEVSAKWKVGLAFDRRR